MLNTRIDKHHNPLRGVVCEPGQMAIRRLLNGVAHDECVNLPSSASGEALVKRALSRIIGAWHNASVSVSHAELKILEDGKFKRTGGAIVTFRLPDRVRAAVEELRLKSTRSVRSKQYRRKIALNLRGEKT